MSESIAGAGQGQRTYTKHFSTNIVSVIANIMSSCLFPLSSEEVSLPEQNVPQRVEVFEALPTQLRCSPCTPCQQVMLGTDKQKSADEVLTRGQRLEVRRFQGFILRHTILDLLPEESVQAMVRVDRNAIVRSLCAWLPRIRKVGR